MHMAPADSLLDTTVETTNQVIACLPLPLLYVSLSVAAWQTQNEYCIFIESLFEHPIMI